MKPITWTFLFSWILLVPMLGAQAPFTEPPLGTQAPILTLDFDSVPTGSIPPGFSSNGPVTVAEGVAHGGKKALKMSPTAKGARRINLTNETLRALGGSHWGRLYFKVETPVPDPVGNIIHATFVSGNAVSPLSNDMTEVRPLGVIVRSNGRFNYLYNVQTKKRGEFGTGEKTNRSFTDGWTLAEWYLDHPTQTFRLFIDGLEVKGPGFSKGAGKFEKAEVPALFKDLSFGWNNYQPAQGAGFTVYIDDIALGKDRLGNRVFSLNK